MCNVVLVSHIQESDSVIRIHVSVLFQFLYLYGLLQSWFMGLQRVGHYWATELNWTEHLSFENSFKKLQRKGNFLTHSMRPPSPWYQNQRQHKKRKLQANIIDEHRCKNPQQNFSKQNSATHQKAHTPWSSWVYSRNARILQYMELN